MLVFGLFLEAIARTAGTAGVLSDRGASHRIPGGLDAIGYTTRGAAGQPFFWGIVVGCITILGLVLILASVPGGVKRRAAAGETPLGASRAGRNRHPPQGRPRRNSSRPLHRRSPKTGAYPPKPIRLPTRSAPRRVIRLGRVSAASADETIEGG